jgi:glycosyltransferase involved in cell wall biosynthesis
MTDKMIRDASTGRRYVLVTAAYNEEALIERLITSVVSQALLPQRWIVVSDGSTDRTDEIVRGYANRYPLIQLFRITEDHPRNFAAQANAINVGFDQLKDCNYDYIGNLDADVSFESTYFERLIVHFENDWKLGLAGGAICEKRHQKFRPRKGNRGYSVANAVQLFRRECLEALGGRYCILPYGGHDWHAEVTARMRGWHVQTISELEVLHHRPTGTGVGLWRHSFQQGLMDYSIGVHPLFEVVKLLARILRQPYIPATLFRLIAFLYAYCRGEKRPVSKEFMEFLRKEQVQRLRALSLLTI